MLLYLSEVQKTTIIGIDFGTSAVRAAVWYNDRVAVLPNEGGNCSIPAYISFDGPDLLVGEKAKLQARSYSKNMYAFFILIYFSFTQSSIASTHPSVSFATWDWKR
jgi:molecular chaperone DnaK (HSP70)